MFYTQFNKIISKLKNLFSHVLIYFDFFFLQKWRCMDWFTWNRSAWRIKRAVGWMWRSNIQKLRCPRSKFDSRRQQMFYGWFYWTVEVGKMRSKIWFCLRRKHGYRKNVEDSFQNTMLLKSVILLLKHPEIYSLLSNFV